MEVANEQQEEMNNRDTANTRLERLSETINEVEDELQGFTDPSRDETAMSEGSGADVRIRQRNTSKKGMTLLALKLHGGTR